MIKMEFEDKTKNFKCTHCKKEFKTFAEAIEDKKDCNADIVTPDTIKIWSLRYE